MDDGTDGIKSTSNNNKKPRKKFEAIWQKAKQNQTSIK